MSKTASPEDFQEPLTFSDPAVQGCPYAAYDKIRPVEPVYKDPVTGHYVLTRYEDVRKALLQHRKFSSNANMLGRRQTEATPIIAKMLDDRGWPLADSIQLLDEPQHRAKRALIDKAFAHWSVKEVTPFIDETVNKLLDTFAERGECEFVSEFAVKLTMRVIAHLLGVSHEDEEQFKEDSRKLQFWSDCAIETISPTITTDRELELAEYNIDFQHFCMANINRLIQKPDQTLLSKLIETVRTPDGEPNIPELLMLMRTVLVAGNETTRFSIASGMRMLVEHPELPGKLRNTPDAIENFVEETLRLLTPIQTLFRRTKEDVEIEGTQIPANSLVEVRYGAANRDPEAFKDAEEFDIEAERRAHLAFGIGIHSCVGMALAREELRMAFAIILNRLTNFRYAKPEDSYEYTAMYISYGLVRLDIAFDTLSNQDAQQ